MIWSQSQGLGLQPHLASKSKPCSYSSPRERFANSPVFLLSPSNSQPLSTLIRFLPHLSPQAIEMAPIISINVPSLASRSASLLESSSTGLSKRWVYYYGSGLSTGGIIAISVISVALFILSIFCLVARARGGYYGWRGYQRAAYVPQQQPQWPGHGPGQAPPAYNANTNLYGMNRGPGTYRPPPMYGGPGTFYDPHNGEHGTGTSHGDGPNAPAPRSRLEEHPALKNHNAPPSTLPTDVGGIAQPQNDRPPQY